MLKTRSWQVDRQWTQLHVRYRQRETKGRILQSSGPRLLCRTAALPTAVPCMWRLSEFIPSWDHEACSGQSEAPLPLQSGLFSLSLSLLLFHSFRSCLSPCRVLGTLQGWTVLWWAEKRQWLLSCPGSLVGETDIKSGSSWSAPWWLAWNRPLEYVGWFANKTPHKPCNEGRERIARRT